MNRKLEIALKVAWSFHGTWYTWGGENPDGFDCSGFVREILLGVGLLPKQDMTAEDIFNYLFPIHISSDISKIFWKSYARTNLIFTEIGGIAFKFAQNTDRIVHIGFMLNSEHVIHASGGGPDVTTLAKAIEKSAFIKVRPIWDNAVFINPF